MSARLLACLVLTLIGAVRSSPALLGTSRHTEEQSTSCESSAPGNGGQLALSTSESSTSNQQSHQGKATLSYTVRWHVVTPSTSTGIANTVSVGYRDGYRNIF
jgi:hypothetical protein